MKELKFPENINIKIDEFDLEISVKPYLTSIETETIVSQMIEEENPIKRENIKNVLIMRLCTDLEAFDKDVIDNETIDIYAINGIFDRVFECINEECLVNIDYYADKIESVSNIMKGISESLKDTVGKISNLDVNSLVKQTMSEVKKVQK